MFWLGLAVGILNGITLWLSEYALQSVRPRSSYYPW